MESIIYVGSFPQIDYMLNVYIDSGRYDAILPDWKGKDSADYHIVASVTDEETEEYYRRVKEKSNEYVSLLQSRLPDNEQWDIELKPLFRFDSTNNAKRFMALLTPYKDVDELNEFILNLRLDYDDGWKPVRAIIGKDFDNPTGFLSFGNK